MMNLLILDQFARDLKRALELGYPELFIHAAAGEDEIGDFASRMDILLTIRISDEAIKNASRLQWIKVRTAGVDWILDLPLSQERDPGDIHSRDSWPSCRRWRCF